METEIPVRDIMTRPVITADAELDILSAAKKMSSANVGSLIIVSGNKPTGILTERDLVKKVLAQGIDPRNLKVAEIMSAPVITADPDWTLKECSQKMQQNNIHHMPVVKEDGTLLGLISVTDIFMAAEEIGWGRNA